MKTIGIVFNSDKPRARAEMRTLTEWLKTRKCRVVMLPSKKAKMPKMDFAITLGGDGTMLRASRFLGPAHIPVLGINMGSLGFLAETNPGEAYAFLDRIIHEGFKTKERMMLAITLTLNGKKISESALNDCTVHSGISGRVVTVRAFVDSEFLGDYVGDGLIISTPTGSTAYSLAASGPIVHPQLSVFILTPVCPHTLTQRPMIIPPTHTLRLSANNVSTQGHPMVSIDGQVSYSLEPGDIVSLKVSPTPLLMIVTQRRKYLEVLREKLRWGERG